MNKNTIKTINCVVAISLSILIATLILGIITLGSAFNFENYKIQHYFILSIYYIAFIATGLKIMLEETNC